MSKMLPSSLKVKVVHLAKQQSGFAGSFRLPGDFCIPDEGVLPDDAHNSESFSLQAVIRYSALVGFAGHFLFLLLFSWLGVAPMAYLNIASCAIFLLCFWTASRGHPHVSIVLGSIEVVIHAYLAVILLGWNSGFHYYIFGLTPLIFYSQTWRIYTKTVFVGVLCALYALLYLYAAQNLPLHPLKVEYVIPLGTVNIVTLFIVFATVAHFYRSAASSAEKALIKANQQLVYLAHTDPLTKLMNRRSMEKRISDQVVSFVHTGKPFSVILGDIDNFKSFNDLYGHDTGDRILINVAAIIQDRLWQEDVVARWGGEEFLILLPGTNREKAQIVAERLRDAIAETPFTMAGKEGHITMTFGVTMYSGGQRAAETIHKADQAMYEGKRRGKNCVMVYS